MKLSGVEASRYLARPDPARAGLLIFGADAMRVALKRQEAIAALIGPAGAVEMRLTRMSGAALRRDPALLMDATKAVGFFPGPRVAFVEEATDGLTDTIAAGLPHVKGGKLRAIAVTSAQRASALPEVATVAESVVPGFEAVSWIGALVPAGTPKEIVDKLHRDFIEVLSMKDVREKLASQGAIAVGNTPAEFDAWNRNEIAKWAQAIKAAGVKGD